MKTAKQSIFLGFNERTTPEDYARAVDGDLINLFNLVQGRVRFNDINDGQRGENISGESQTFTSQTSANVEFSISHGIGAIPKGFIVVDQDRAGSLYSSGTWTDSAALFKSDATSTNFKIFLLK